MTSRYQPETCQFLKLGPMLQFKTSMVTVAFKNGIVLEQLMKATLPPTPSRNGWI